MTISFTKSIPRVLCPKCYIDELVGFASPCEGEEEEADRSCGCLCFLGESVEENANVVVRLLIRRPECFGPALRGEGGNGLLAAIEEAIKISEDPARDGPTVKKDRRFPM